MAGRPFTGLSGHMITRTMFGVATLIGATCLTALVALLLFSFAYSVMPGLSALDDHSFLTAFQRIDAAVANPWTTLVFIGSPTLTLTALFLHLPDRSRPVPWLVAALVLTLATVVITRTVHLPLNAAVQNAAPDLADAVELRSRFEDRWVRWNVIRTVTSTASLAALSWALFLSGRSAG